MSSLHLTSHLSACEFLLRRDEYKLILLSQTLPFEKKNNHFFFQYNYFHVQHYYNFSIQVQFAEVMQYFCWFWWKMSYRFHYNLSKVLIVKSKQKIPDSLDYNTHHTSHITYHLLNSILHTGPVAPVAPFADFSGAQVSFLSWAPLCEASALMSGHSDWSKFFFPRMYNQSKVRGSIILDLHFGNYVKI